MKRNIESLWWNDFITTRKDCVGIDTSIILNPLGISIFSYKSYVYNIEIYEIYIYIYICIYICVCVCLVWHSSGHTSNFSDPLTECNSCQKRLRY